MKLHALIFASALIMTGSTAQAMNMNDKKQQETLLWKKEMDEKIKQKEREKACGSIAGCCRDCFTSDCCKWICCYCGITQQE